MYFINGSQLLGSWESGVWRSINDTGGKYGDEHSNDFYFKDILSNTRFTLYSRTGKIGYSDYALINAADGVSGFWDSDKTELFAPYAKPDPANLWSSSMEIPLPTAFGPEMDDIKIPDYGYDLRFSYDNIDLATNSPHDLNAARKVVWESYSVEERDHAALKELLGKNKLYGETHFNNTAMADLDGDGAEELLLFANTAKDEGGYLEFSVEDGGFYSVLLLRHADGSYETVYERYHGYTSDVTSQFSMDTLGIYDLNGDGTYEICAVMGEWEGGYNFVLSQDKNGEWKTVLRSNWGT